MTEPRDFDVQVAPDCGNSPRQAQVRDWLVALASADVDAVCAALAEDVVWETPDGTTLTGLVAVRREVERLAQQPSSVLRIRCLVSHGKEVAAAGSRVSAGVEAQFGCFVTYTGHSTTAKIASVLAFRKL